MIWSKVNLQNRSRKQSILSQASEQELPLRMIAEKYNVSVSYVSKVCVKAGICYPGRRTGRRRKS